jgi:hypothetical protein
MRVDVQMPFRLVGGRGVVKIPGGADGRGLGFLPRASRGMRSDARGARRGGSMGTGSRLPALTVGGHFSGWGGQRPVKDRP